MRKRQFEFLPNLTYASDCQVGAHTAEYFRFLQEWALYNLLLLNMESPHKATQYTKEKVNKKTHKSPVEAEPGIGGARL